MGLGYWGPNLVRCVTEIEGADVKAICDRSTAALAKLVRRYPAIGGTQDLDRLLEDPEIAANVAPASTSVRLLLVSPIRNEVEHIERVVRGLLDQARPPDLWVVVEDNSTDGTAQLLERLAPDVPFMRLVHAPPGFTRDTGDRNAAGGPDRAFNYGLQEVDWRTFTHLGKLDGDIVLPPEYLHGMLAKFEEDPRLGIAGGVVTEPASGGGWRELRTPPDHATAPARLYSLRCFEEIGGMPSQLGADLITTMYAKLRGFRTRTFADLPVRHLRPMATADGVRRGRMRQGAYQYIVHYYPWWVLLRAFVIAARWRPYGLSGVWFLLGYFKAALGPTASVADPELRAFIRRDQRERVRRLAVRTLGRQHQSGMTRPDRPHRAHSVARALEAHGDQCDWLGPDPYEGMNATRLVGPLKGSAMGRRVLLQIVKRSPIDLRPFLGIAPTPNSATAAFVTSIYARGGFLERAEADAKLRAAVDRLVDLRSPQFEEPCWGYQFATQSRVVFYDKSEPSTVATTFAAMALLDAYERLGDESLLDLAVGAARFFLRHVPQTAEPPGAFFGYLVGDRTPIHNSNLHACAVLARVASFRDEPGFRAAARAGVEWTLARQRPDGSWPYGEQPNLDWVDNFHTAYVLESLRVCADAGVHEDIEAAWRRGLDYWRRSLFLEDGTPKYYSDKVHPVDGQCVAQAIQMFAIASLHEPSYREDAWRTFEWALRHMRRRDGLFYFQRRRFWVNPIPHMRWVQAPMLLALTRLLEFEASDAPTLP